eukprot:9507962-Karenia_brevis.AAC.1
MEAKRTRDAAAHGCTNNLKAALLSEEQQNSIWDAVSSSFKAGSGSVPNAPHYVQANVHNL